MKTKLARDVDNLNVLNSIHACPKPGKEKKPRLPKLKVKKLDPDYWFSLCVRERAGWTCECCGKHYEPTISEVTGNPANPGLHCSHYIGRANYSTRFDPLNADAHCYGCHAKFEGNPHLFLGWKVEQLGNERYDILIEKFNNIMIGKQARQEKQEIAEYYRSEYFRMQELRAQGVTGRIDFIGWI